MQTQQQVTRTGAINSTLAGRRAGGARCNCPYVTTRDGTELFVKDWGDVVGMTAGYEADLCAEAGLNYNSFAIIDNYANGLEGTEIDFARFKDLVKTNQEKVNRLFSRMLEILG